MEYDQLIYRNEAEPGREPERSPVPLFGPPDRLLAFLPHVLDRKSNAPGSVSLPPELLQRSYSNVPQAFGTRRRLAERDRVTAVQASRYGRPSSSKPEFG